MNWTALALILIGVAYRVAPHPWNFAPIGAIALFGGAHFERRWAAIAIPLVAMLAGDAVIGFHRLMPVIYATYALIAVMGILLREHRSSVARVGGASLLGSVLFFITTNFAVWEMGTTYSHDGAGLVRCYVAAIPYFGNTIASDLAFTAIFFGSYALAVRRHAQRT